MSKALRIFQGSFGRVALLDMTAPLVVHAHSQCHVLLKSSGADTLFRVRGRSCYLSEDTAVLINTWEPHAYTHQPGAPQTLILALYIEPYWLSAIDGHFRSSAHPRFFPEPCVSLTPPVKRLAQRLTAEMLADGELDEQTLENLMCSVIMHFSGFRSLDGAPAASPLFSDYRIRKAITYMKANPRGSYEINQLSAIAGLSRPHFFAMFRRCTAMTPAVFANVLRVETAVAALAQGEDSIGALSAELGFDAQSHFTRFFRHHLGITPSDYRRVVNLVN